MNVFSLRSDQKESEGRKTEGPGACWESKLLKCHTNPFKITHICEQILFFGFIILTVDITFAIAEPRYAQKNATEK